MLRHYMEVKAEHPDAILLYRMGDFYETFFEDAEIAAPIFEIQLTARQKGTPSEAPKRYLAITEASMAEGKYREAMAWGAEMQAFVAEQSGLVSVFGAATYGGFADLVWLLGADSMAESTILGRGSYVARGLAFLVIDLPGQGAARQASMASGANSSTRRTTSRAARA